MKKIEAWECEFCGTSYYTRKECEECEKKCKAVKAGQYIKFFNKTFPSYHSKDSGMLKHCVGCGLMVTNHQPFLNGVRCGNCIKAAKMKLGKLLMEEEDKDEKQKSNP